MRRKELDLYRSCRRASRAPGRYEWLWYLPVVLVLAASLCAYGHLKAQNRVLEDRISQLREQIAQQEAEYRTAERKWAYNELLMRYTEDLEALSKSRDTYPEVTSALLERIAAVGGDHVTMALGGYDSSTGELSFLAKSAQVIDIPDYVSALRATGLFSAVEYSGYQYEAGVYTLDIRCVLHMGGAS